ncbi:anaerobic ribonucleoside-triphosphate reductase [Staphylococcus intermedius]|uniref:Anaerobic ribonucleoside-triphosphate reductase n=2 Tax=Staphylococcus TaxID=1279 RepID=A0A380G5A2_STAIN|nr:anaerobic ribonucleoside-triphosphate reductase [Staphylococcus intermedius]PCF64015.1 anaerobic ribonucleoside-triphosphate reductase [Staphylococcus intermedius]PCF78730.1 anaerobic ribonucleoside-triphosphate reductase [Staphylococcus intermedius]PCF79703.1 anaerobic ribonucleoside-triphosphate reductase [Staphylococcus intermedius]PCF85947.1 anaerobic ribonucleoside-triphosphate reductase [Staphylococcus intermedius]PCF89638.1 anaerobic ribonucleoside-triphosphate reductase [Staphylococ
MTQLEKQLTGLMTKDPTIVNENANKDSETFSTMRDLTAGVVSKSYALQHLLPSHVAQAHQKGEIHFHDLDYHPFQPLTNCCLIDAKGMMANGFQIGNAQVTSPKSIQTAAAQLVQIIANVSSSQYGGCTIDRVDELLSHYAHFNEEKHREVAREFVKDDQIDAYVDKRVTQDIADAVESLEYEINTLYTSNGQTPFVTLGFGLGEDELSRKVQKAILKTRIKGLGKDRITAIFPKLVFSIKKGTNFAPEDPNYDIKQLALQCAMKRMYPDILNYDKTVELLGDFKAPMGCRSFLPAWQNAQGAFENNGRCNLGVVTLNIPRIAIESGGDMTRFWDLFDERMQVLHDALVYRIERVKEAVPNNAPILYKRGAFKYRINEEDPVDTFFNQQRATISMGYIGLYEAATVFFGPNWETNPEAKDFTLNILRQMKNYQHEWTAQYDIWFSIYSTPSESLTDRFCRLDREAFGDIPDITDKGYYQNSFHYDVRKDVTPFEKLDFEKEYPYLASGGYIHYCEYPKLDHNVKALETVWDYAYDRVSYLGTNIPIDHCYDCGFEGDFDTTETGYRCPECGNQNPETVDVVKRTCGYLGNPVQRPTIEGRHKEMCARVKHLKVRPS